MGFKLWFNLLVASNYIYVLVHLQIYVCKKVKVKFWFYIVSREIAIYGLFHQDWAAGGSYTRCKTPTHSLHTHHSFTETEKCMCTHSHGHAYSSHTYLTFPATPAPLAVLRILRNTATFSLSAVCESMHVSWHTNLTSIQTTAADLQWKLFVSEMPNSNTHTHTHAHNFYLRHASKTASKHFKWEMLSSALWLGYKHHSIQMVAFLPTLCFKCKCTHTDFCPETEPSQQGTGHFFPPVHKSSYVSRLSVKTHTHTHT